MVWTIMDQVGHNARILSCENADDLPSEKREGRRLCFVYVFVHIPSPFYLILFIYFGILCIFIVTSRQQFSWDQYVSVNLGSGPVESFSLSRNVNFTNVTMIFAPGNALHCLFLLFLHIILRASSNHISVSM